MPKFLFLMLGLPGQPAAGDEETRSYHRKWDQYMGALAQRGALESGAPLEPAGKTVSRDTVSDTRLASPDTYGFMVVEAESLEEAVVIAREAPHIALGGSTIVRPCVTLPSTATPA